MSLNTARAAGHKLIPRYSFLIILFILTIHSINLANAQTENPTLLILSQNSVNVKKVEFTDLAINLATAIKESGRLNVIVYRPGLPAIRKALEDKKIEPQNILPPINILNSRKIASVTGSTYLIRLSAMWSKEKLAVDATLENEINPGKWNTVFTSHIAPPKSKRALSYAEQTHIQINQIIQHIESSPQIGEMPIAKRISSDAINTDITNQTAKPVAQNNANAKIVISNGNTPPADTGVKAATSVYDVLIVRARKNGDMANLIVSLRRAINDNPLDIALRRDLIKAYTDRGWKDAARDEARRALKFSPDDSSLHRLIGDEYLKDGDYQAAAREYTDAVRINPRDALIQVSLGDIHWQNAKPDEAIAVWRNASEIDPKLALPHRRLAKYFIMKEQFAESARELSIASSLTAPDDRADFRGDYIQILKIIQDDTSSLLAKMATTRKGFADGTLNREETYKAYTAHKKTSEGIAAFLDNLPSEEFKKIQALFSQTSLIIGQACESSLQFLETQNSSDEEQATLLRMEAANELADISKKLRDIK